MRPPISTSEVLSRIAGSTPPQKATAQAKHPRTQIEVIRDLMLRASDAETWLTLAEIARATKFGEASISAQLRRLRAESHLLRKRRRQGAYQQIAGIRRMVIEYRLERRV